MAYFKGNHSFKRHARASHRRGEDRGPFHNLFYFSLPQISGISSVVPHVPTHGSSCVTPQETGCKVRGVAKDSSCEAGSGTSVL